MPAEVESSRTDFEVLGLGLEGQVLGLGLGLEASSPRKLACPRLEDSTNFWKVKILWRSLEKFLWRPFFFFFLESTCALCPWSLALASSIPVLGLESVCPRKGCPWPWPWPRIFFVSLASSLVFSTPPLGAGTSKVKGGSFFKGHFQDCTLSHYHQHCRNTVKQLNTLPKQKVLSTSNKQ